MKQSIVDLRRESECNGVENYVAIEAMEVGRQRAEAAQWTFQRIKNSLDNQQTSLSGNSVFKHTSLLCEPLLIQRSWLSVLLKFIYSEKATKFCEIFTLLLTVWQYIGQK